MKKSSVSLAVPVLLLALSLSARAQTPAVDFDQGIDVKSALSSAQEGAKSEKPVQAA